MSFFDQLKNTLTNSAKASISNSLNASVSSAKSSIRSSANKAIANAEKSIKKAIETKSKSFKFDSIPTSVEELKALPGGDMKDPFASAAMTILALNMYYANKEVGVAAFDYVMGPGALANLEIGRIDMSMTHNGAKIPLSYFEGATNENNYVPNQPYTIKVMEFPNSKELYDQGYYRLFVRSGGADSERQITLRTKKSTGEWFAHEFSAIYMSIKTAKEDDPWA